MDPELARFFAHWVPHLRGQRSVSELEMALGRSRSSGECLQFYRTLMERNAAVILASLFPATRAAFIALAPQRWSELVLRYERTEPSTHLDPNEFGRAFPALVARARIELALPRVLEELADYEWAHYALGAGGAVEDETADWDRSSGAAFVVRRYEYDVPKITHEIRTSLVRIPWASKSVSVLLYRDLRTGHARIVYPSRALLVALACRGPLAPQYRAEANSLGSAVMHAAEQFLAEMDLSPLPCSSSRGVDVGPPAG